MAPSTDDLEAKLRATVKEVYFSDNQDDLTVRFIRDKVEEEVGLEKGFFLKNEWKAKSKEIIKSYADQLIEEGSIGNTSTIEVLPQPKKRVTAKTATIEIVPEPKKSTISNSSTIKAIPEPKKRSISTVKKSTKRSSAEQKLPPTKRQKKGKPFPEDDISSELSEPESSLSAFDDSDDGEAPKPKRFVKSKSRTSMNRQTKTKAKVELDKSDEDEVSELSSAIHDEDSNAAPPSPKKKVTPKKTLNVPASSKRQSKNAVVKSNEESKDITAKKGKISSSEEEATKKKSISPAKSKSPLIQKHKQSSKPSIPDSEDEDQKADTKANDSDSSAMSVVLDEGPKPKRKHKSKSETASSSKSSKPKLSSKNTNPAKELSPANVQIKTLQAQLLKCGVRKIWGFELKKYEEDDQKKIKHLQRMLRDIGMSGRFSEQRAKEIKELRELQADLEAVREGDSSWGLGSGRRARGQRKSLKEDSEREDAEGEGSEGEKTGSHAASDGPRHKAARAKQELAFLGDDDESDSD